MPPTEGRATAQNRWAAVGLAALAGLMAASGQVPLALWPVALAGFAMALWLHMGAVTARQAAGRGWIFGTAYFAGTLFWIVEPFFVDSAHDGWMAPFALVFMAGGMALFWGAAAWGARRLNAGIPGWIVAMALAELARSYVLTGFPWALVGYVWSETWAAQIVAQIGPHGLSFVTLVLAALLYVTVHTRRVVPGALLVILLGALFGQGWWVRHLPMPDDTGVRLRIVQPNVPQAEKWDPEKGPDHFHRMLALTAAEGPRDLTIWPETAVPVWLSQSDEVLGLAAEAAGGSTLVTGINADAFPRAYNALIVVAPDGAITARYEKHHLAPFGEYIPADWLLSRIGLSAFTAREGYGFSPGPGPKLLYLGAAGRALPLICYEGIFPQDLRGTDRPNWLLQITNDAWFGQLAGPQQHLAQVRLRAIEQGLPMVRAANSGISAVIDARGRVRESLALGTSGIIDAGLPGALPATLYSRTGDWPVALLLVGFLIVLRIRLTRQKV